MQTILNVSTLIKIRVAGILFLINLIVPTINWMFILSSFLTNEDSIATKILENEFMFRFNILNQIITSISILMLAWILFLALKPVSPGISLLALLLKAFESVATLFIALAFLCLLIVTKSGFNQEKLLYGLIQNYINITSVSGIFMGMSMLIFTAIFLKSGIIPGWLAIFGFCAYILVIIYDSSVLLSAGYTSKACIQMVCCAPVGIFQIFISIWFLFKKHKL